jgi:hypothetical protein
VFKVSLSSDDPKSIICLKKKKKKMTSEVKGQEMKNAFIHPGSMCTKFYKAQMALSNNFP